MSEFKGTPGPLTVRQQNKWPFDIEIVDASGEVVFTEKRFAYSTSHKSLEDVMNAVGISGANSNLAIEGNARQLADAYLRAAAPDLLDALIALRSAELEDNCSAESILALRAKADAAIRKALGEDV